MMSVVVEVHTSKSVVPYTSWDFGEGDYAFNRFPKVGPGRLEVHGFGFQAHRVRGGGPLLAIFKVFCCFQGSSFQNTALS